VFWLCGFVVASPCGSSAGFGAMRCYAITATGTVSMNWSLTIALPLVLAAAPVHASYWEMTCPNPQEDLPPDTISSDPERGYLLFIGASGNGLYLVDSSSPLHEGELTIQAVPTARRW